MAAHTGLTGAELPPRKSGHDEGSLDPVEREFLRFFANAGGSVTSSLSLFHLPNQGRCYIANDDIAEDDDLFTIPRSALLNTGTSMLPVLCRAYEQKHGLVASVASDQPAKGDNDMSIDEIVTGKGATSPQTFDELDGWSPLIVCMMWENWRVSDHGAASASSLVNDYKDALQSGDDASRNSENSCSTQYQDWKGYLEIMPKDFSNMPMFWTSAELQELRGTSVVQRIGKDEADAEYEQNVKPFILRHGEIFFGSDETEDNYGRLVEQFYSLENFHTQGSRILSRSFHVKPPSTRDVQEGLAVGAADAPEEGSDDSDEEDEEQEDTADISMVPMADMLNASYSADNARLFYSNESLIMRATRNIRRGEQILNTYSDPPNADLLRRYGYVDEWNGADEVELEASDLIAAAMVERAEATTEEALTGRIAYLVSLGTDESFVLTYPFPPSEEAPHRPEPESPTSQEIQSAVSNFDEELLSAARGLLLTEEEFEKHRTKEKVPKPRLDQPISSLLIRAMSSRLEKYAGGVGSEADEQLLYGGKGTEVAKGTNLRSAIVVRLGEKRILESNVTLLRRLMEIKAAESSANGKDSTKRKGGGTQEKSSSKKVRK